MKLKEYQTIEEKEVFFKGGDGKIFSADSFNKLLVKLEDLQQTESTFIYRGSCEAKYKMYNSAQRVFINNELFKQKEPKNLHDNYVQYIANLIESSKDWNKGVISKLLKSYEIEENNSLAYLSFMQHYGIPTPFLDFTSNPFVALFFAIDNLYYTPSNNEIDNYFSIYYSFSDAPVFQIWNAVFDKTTDYSYNKVDKNILNILTHDNNAFKILNNVNIINQEGLFFYNNDPLRPLEETYKEYLEIMQAKIGKEDWARITLVNNIYGCFNIHKSLIPLVRKKLEEKGITKGYIYPDMNNFKETVMNEGILRSLGII